MSIGQFRLNSIEPSLRSSTLFSKGRVNGPNEDTERA
jgi:hypothetical protein